MSLIVALACLTINPGDTLTGLDVLEAQRFVPLAGKRIGLVTNHTGIDREGRRNVDLMLANGVKVTVLFSPEHGLAGVEDREGIGNAVDTATGLPVFSLYGESRRPSPQILKGLDALVFDIQDVGVRFYTYETTMAFAIESAAMAGVPFIVLDRPNPITGTRVEGPPLDPSNASFVGYLPGCPVRHGLTMGELATLFNGEMKLGASLSVIKMQNWSRDDWFDSTGLPWVNPSPNMRSLKAAILYPGICLVEFARNLSVGRGTDSPFEQVGAEWIKGRQLAAYLNARGLPGLRFYPIRFTPTESNGKGKLLEGIRIEIVDRKRVLSVRLGIELACALQHLYPGKIDWTPGKLLIGHGETLRRITNGDDPKEIESEYRSSVEKFSRLRRKYLIY